MPPTKYWKSPITMIIARTASRSRTMIRRPSALPIVLVSVDCVVFRAPDIIVGVAVRMPLSTGSITTIRIATIMKAITAAMTICTNARESQSLAFCIVARILMYKSPTVCKKMKAKPYIVVQMFDME